MDFPKGVLNIVMHTENNTWIFYNGENFALQNESQNNFRNNVGDFSGNNMVNFSTLPTLA